MAVWMTKFSPKSGISENRRVDDRCVLPWTCRCWGWVSKAHGKMCAFRALGAREDVLSSSHRTILTSNTTESWIFSNECWRVCFDLNLKSGTWNTHSCPTRLRDAMGEDSSLVPIDRCHRNVKGWKAKNPLGRSRSAEDTSRAFLCYARQASYSCSGEGRRMSWSETYTSFLRWSDLKSNSLYFEGAIEPLFAFATCLSRLWWLLCSYERLHRADLVLVSGEIAARLYVYINMHSFQSQKLRGIGAFAHVQSRTPTTSRRAWSLWSLWSLRHLPKCFLIETATFLSFADAVFTELLNIA